jgi:NADH:ubiquinone oxidoreductase subunit F (NADH-binding)
VATQVVVTPNGFVAGQETAVIEAIEGRPARPRDQLVRIAERGVNRAPTLLQNVETLAHVALIARHGAQWFREVGDDRQPGTFLATVTGAVKSRGVIETSYGVRLDHLIEMAGGATKPLQAVLVGGYHGAWAPARADLTVSAAGLAPFGASVGAGVVVALPASTCGLAYAAGVVDYLAAQSARQCGPCSQGLPRMARALSQLARRERVADARLVGEISHLARIVTGRGACAHPDGAARFVSSTLSLFSADVRAHLAGTCLVGSG